MSGLRKVVDEKDARACLSSVARSRETLRGWAQRNQVDGRSLRAWQLSLWRRGTGALAKSTPAKLVEIVPTSMTVTACRYVVRVADGAVEVGDDFDAATLSRILEVLRAC